MNPTLPSFLSSMRLQAFMQATQDIRFGQLPVWAGRVPNVNATDDEIFAKVENYADAADIVLDGGKAVVSAPDKLKIVTTTLANIKRGQRINQSTMNLLVRLTSGVATRGDQVTFDTYLANTMRKRRLACEIRRAWLVCGMVAETGLAYDRLGVKLSGVDFGAPSGLKVTLAGGNKWDAPTTSDGIKDIVELARTARTEYGENYNRVTMSTSAFLKLTAQDSFKARAQSLQAGSLGSVAVPLATDDVLRTVIGRLIGMTVEIDDAMYREENEDGTVASGRYVPEDLVILSNSAYDNSQDIADFGNAVVTESLVAQLVPGVIGGVAGEAYGPLAYATGGHNPPEITIWGVQRGFPRKHRETAFAKIDAW